MSDRNNMKLFTLNSNPEIAQKIADTVGVPLGKLSSRQFSDGEIQVNIEESVRGYDVYIIQSTSYPVSNHLMELLIMVDACVRASAHSINVVLPYFGYARQDRIASSREPLTAKLVANMLVKAGVSRVLTLDLHAVQVQGFFDIPVDNLILFLYLLSTTVIKVFLALMSLLLVQRTLVLNVHVVWLNTLMLLSLSLTTPKTILIVTKAISLGMLKARRLS